MVSFDHEKYMALLQFITDELLSLSSLNDDPFIFIRKGNLVPYLTETEKNLGDIGETFLLHLSKFLKCPPFLCEDRKGS